LYTIHLRIEEFQIEQEKTLNVIMYFVDVKDFVVVVVVVDVKDYTIKFSV